MKKANFTKKGDGVCSSQASFCVEGARDCCTRNGFSYFLKTLSLVFLLTGFAVVDSFAQCPITATLECEADGTAANAEAAATVALAGAIGPCTVMTTGSTLLVDTRNGNDCDAIGSVVYGVDITLDCDGDGVADAMLNCNVTYNFSGDMTAPTVATAPGTPGAWTCGGAVPANPSDPTGTDGTTCGGAVTVTQNAPFPNVTTDPCSGLRTATWTWTLTDACGNTNTASTSAMEAAPTTADVTFAGVPGPVTVECNTAAPGDPGGISAGTACAGGLTFTITYSQTDNTGACPGNGTVVNTWTATDDCGLGITATATQTVTVDDTMAPTLVGACPAAAQNVSVDATCSATIPDLTGSITLMDNCDPAPTASQSVAAGTAFTIDADGGCARAGMAVGPDVVVTLSGTDCDGNTSGVLCTVTLTPIDDTPPTITAPATIDVKVDFDGATCVMGTTTVDDAFLLANGVVLTESCDPNPTLNCAACPLTYSCADIGTTVPISITASDCNGNTSAATMITLNIIGDDDFTAEWTNPGPLCTTGGPYDLTANLGAMTPTCGTWSGDAVSATGMFTPTTAGSYAVTYTVSGPDCHTELTRVIEVTAPKSVGTPNSGGICAAIPINEWINRSFLFPGSDDGGTLTQISGPFALIVSEKEILFGSPGCYEFSYSFTGAQGGACGAVAAATVSVWIGEQPEPSFDLAEEACWDGTAGSLKLTPLVNSPSYTSPVTRTWSSSDVTVATVDAATGVVTATGAGTVQICMTETTEASAAGSACGAHSCTATQCHTLTISNATTAANPSWTNPGPLCSDDAAVDLSALVTGTTGGVFTGNGVTGSTFNPATAGAGTHAVTYTVGSGGCFAVMTHNIVVHAAKVPNVDYKPVVELACATELLDVNGITASISGVQLFSQYSMGTYDLSGLWITGAPAGGTWSLVSAPDLQGFPTSGAVVGEVLYFTDPGCYEVKYDAFPGADGGCSVTTSIYVGQKPVPGIDFPEMFCFNDNVNSGNNGHTESADTYVTSPDYFNAFADPTLSPASSRTFSSDNPAVISFTQTAGSSAGSLGTWDINVNGVGTAVVTMEESFQGDASGCGNPGFGAFCTVSTQQVIEVRAIDFNPAACACSSGKRAVDLGTVSTPAGIASGAPFTVEFTGGTLDLNNDGVADVTNGTHLVPVDGSDLGQLILNPLEESWSITIVDNKGCEIFRSGDCSAIPNKPTVATCPSNITQVTDAGLCTAAVTYAAPTFNDNCDGTGLAGTLTAGLASGSAFPLGTTTVTYQYTDTEGSEPAVCTFTVTVMDGQAPTMICPPAAMVQCSADEIPTADTWPEFLIQGGMITDNCTLNQGSFSSLGDAQLGNVVTRTYTMSDEAGNPALCFQTITIMDTTNPVFTVCPGNIVYNTEPDNCGTHVNWQGPAATDNCALNTILRTDVTGLNSGDVFPVGTTTIEYTAFDAAMNSSICTFTVTVTDAVKPVIQCPTVNLVKGTNNACSFDMGSAAFDATATDNCPGVVLTNSYNGGATLNGANFPLGNTTVTWTATDAAGNTASCSMTITVEDDDAPTVDCSAINPARVADAGVCTFTMPGTGFDATFADNCPGASISNDYNNAASLAGASFPVGVTTVTWTATDAAGNTASCSVDITITDDQIPTMTCPPAATAQCSAAEVPVADNLVEFFAQGGVATDNCAIDDLLFGLLTETTAGNVVTRTYSVTDVNGNANLCTQTITITDTTAPVFTNCPTTTITVGNDPDECSAKVNWSIPVATDNCGDVTVTSTGAASGSVLAVGSHTATYTATDLAGNKATCVINIMVMDTQDPLITACAADRNINTNPGVCNGTVPDMTSEITYIENCPGAVVTQSPAAGSTFGAAPGDQVTVTFTVTDASGNTATCTNKLTLVDNEPPNAVCANPTIGLDVFGNASVTANDLAGASTDNCGAVTLDILSGQTAYTCADVGKTYDVVVKVSDSSGNMSQCTSTVTVVEGAATCDPVLSINDPCVCSAIPGHFDEVITVNALAGQTWTVVSATGLLSAPGQPVTAGTALTENPLGTYTLTGLHLGGVGYSITVQNEFGQQLSISNTCYLPEPVITGVDDFSTACDDPFTVSGSEASGLTGEAGTILTVDGPAGYHQEAPFPGGYNITINPSTLQSGTYTVCFAFDAGVAANNNPNDPGCIVTECQDFQIINPVSGMTCNDNVNVSLDETCCVKITPDMVLEGDIGPDGVFDVTITDLIGTPLNPVDVVCANHIGQDLIVKVTDPCSGQSCWGHLNVEDKLAPTLTCPADITVFCNQDTDPSVTGNASVDDCSSWTLDYTDDETFFGNCEPNVRVIVRSFVAVDEHGNEAACSQTITVKRPLLSEIHFPEDIQWTCDNYNVFPNITDATPRHPFVGDSDPSTPNFFEVVLDENCDDNDADLPFLPPNHTEDNPDINSTNIINGGSGCPGFEPFQFPAVNGLDDADVLELTGSGIPTLGGDLFQGVGSCMLSVTWSDEYYDICSGSFEILRTWKVRDMCLPVGPDNPAVHVQVIKVLDQKPPQVAGPADLTVSANIPAVHPDECRAAFFLPPLSITDNCSDGWTVEVDHPLGHIDGNGGFVDGLPRGDHQATYTIVDDCGNVTTFEMTIHVVDDIAPTVQCDEITSANLSSDGKVTVPADVFDDGTHDNCCLDHFEVRRMSGGNFGPSVTFNCNDVTASPVTVIMRAYDCEGNSNDCMVQVIVNDKLPPAVLSCPGPQSITCDFYWDNIETQLSLGDNSVLDQFGTPLFQDNCDLTIDHNVTTNIDQCGEGTIVRTWQATDPSGNGPATCTQVITLNTVSDWVVEFPADALVTCTDDVPDFGEPKITNETCELIAVSYEDTYYNAVPDACYKISRTWKVINWCVVGDFVDEEVVEVPENELGLPFPLCDLDGDGDCDGRTFRDSWNADSRPTAADATTITGPDTDPDTDPWDGYITYQQNIKVIDNVAPVVTCAPHQDVCIEDSSCSADLTVPGPDVQDCSTQITVSATSDLPNFNGADFSATGVGVGNYTVTFQVTDNCGNSSACQTTVEVRDCKKPTPYCKNGVIVEIMQTGMIQVWASDLNAGSFDNCTAVADLEISFSSDVADKGRTYTCDDLGFQNVEIWVTDEAGNQDFCNTTVHVQDNMNACGNTDPLVVVDGGITTESNNPVAMVDVELNGGAQMITTGNDGQYSFNVPQGDDITITPVKDIDPLNGVTTFDLVLITKHILGVKLLDSPYKIIAADVNKSESVTTFDLVKLRKLILHVDDNFTDNTSWRFVDANYVFNDPTNPLAENFPEVVSINNVPANVTADFIAVKVGDVNGSADPISFSSADDRNATDNLVFQVEDKQLESGNTYTVDFKAKDFNVLGYQFTLNFNTDALELVSIVPGIASEDNFGLRFLEEGAITTSWNEEARNVADGEVVFSLVFNAKDNAQLSDVLNVNSRYTAAEAYSNDGELMDVDLEFNGQVVGSFDLYQNTPNPFKETTTIGFNLPQADAATLTVSDATGRVLLVIEGDYAKGYNEVTIDRKALGAAGLLYYQLETSTDTATRTMLLVE